MNDNLAYEILCYLSENSPLVDWEVERDLMREALRITARLEVRGKVVAISEFLSRYELQAGKDVSAMMNCIIYKMTGELSKAIISWRPGPGEEIPLPMSARRSVAMASPINTLEPLGELWEALR